MLRDSIAHLKEERKRSAIHLAAQKPAVTTKTVFEKLVRHVLYHLLYNALKALPLGSQKVISIYFLEDKNINDIARESNLHPSIVKTQKSRGLEVLRNFMS